MSLEIAKANPETTDVEAEVMCAVCEQLCPSSSARVFVYRSEYEGTIVCHSCYLNDISADYTLDSTRTWFKIVPAPKDEFADEVAALVKKTTKVAAAAATNSAETETRPPPPHAASDGVSEPAKKKAKRT